MSIQGLWDEITCKQTISENWIYLRISENCDYLPYTWLLYHLPCCFCLEQKCCNLNYHFFPFVLNFYWMYNNLSNKFIFIYTLQSYCPCFQWLKHPIKNELGYYFLILILFSLSLEHFRFHQYNYFIIASFIRDWTLFSYFENKY